MNKNYAGKILCLFFTLVSPLLLHAQTTEPEPSPYIYATTASLYSQYLNEERTVLVYLPPSYSTQRSNYPVIYVTDGDAHIHHLSGIVRFLTDNQLMPDSIIVAIPHADRNRDLLPQTTRTTNQSGQADIFLSFIEYELIPFIDSHYRTHPFKVLAGHSYGGLFVNYTMITHPDLFNAYIAADPSLWWDNQRMKDDTVTFFQTHGTFEKSYYFNQSEIPGMGGVEYRNMLLTNAPDTMPWMFERMADETHGSIVHKSYYNGLEFVFQDWPMAQVSISPEGGLFRAGQSVSVTMTHPLNGTIRYTTDGSFPTYESAVYNGPIAVTQNSTIRASLFLSNNRITIPAEAVFSEAVLYPALTNLPDLESGASYEYYEGQWSVLPDFDTLYPTDSGSISGVNIVPWLGRDNFGVRFTGYVNISQEGIYAFSLSSDDGSRMFIDDVELIDNDGLHADEEQIGYILLASGYHKFEVCFFERGGDEVLSLRYRLPGQSYFRILPNSMLYH